MKQANQNLLRTLRLTQEMLALADEGDRDRTDDSCGILYGVLRDAAYRIRNLAQTECDKHRASGRWEAPPPAGTPEGKKKNAAGQATGLNRSEDDHDQTR